MAVRVRGRAPTLVAAQDALRDAFVKSGAGLSVQGPTDEERRTEAPVGCSVLRGILALHAIFSEPRVFEYGSPMDTYVAPAVVVLFLVFAVLHVRPPIGR